MKEAVASSFSNSSGMLAYGNCPIHLPSGIAVTNPEKILTLLAAWRNLGRDTLAITSLAGVQPLLDTSKRPYAIGGADAAIQYLDGWNNVSSRGRRIVYLPENPSVHDLPEGDEVTVLVMDKRAQRETNSAAFVLSSTGWATPLIHPSSSGAGRHGCASAASSSSLATST